MMRGTSGTSWYLPQSRHSLYQPPLSLRSRCQRCSPNQQRHDLATLLYPTPASRNARLSRSISRAITRRCTSCVPS